MDNIFPETIEKFISMAHTTYVDECSNEISPCMVLFLKCVMLLLISVIYI